MDDLLKYRWMPHHEGAVPPAGQGKRISTYTVSLEAWRRGLDLTFYSYFDEDNLLKIRYSIGNGEKVHHFSLSMGDKVTDEAFYICDNKETTKQYLSKNNVPVPRGKMFTADATDEEIISYAEELGYPVVIKPTDGNAGKGVFANIQSAEALKSLVSYVREELGYREIIVEDYITGDEFRIIVLGDRVLGAMNRRPASVLGDGVHTIQQLINRANKVRKMNPHLTSRLIKRDREIEAMLLRQNYTFKSVPEKGKRVFLREKSNLSTGGDAIDVTDQLTEGIKKIAIDAGKAIPGLSHYGVDMIVDLDNDTGHILEVNARPGLGGHLFPMEGKPRDFAKDIIDFYFPETKDVERSYLYFDFDSILEPLTARSADRVEVIKPPVGKLYSKKYIVSGKVQQVGYRNRIRREAIARELHGYAENMEDGTVVVLVAGTDRQVVDDFKQVCFEGSDRSEVEDVQEQEWGKPVKIGFEVKKTRNLKPSEVRRLIREKEDLEKEREQLEHSINRLREGYRNLHNSKSWKLTSPLRSIYKLMRK